MPHPVPIDGKFDHDERVSFDKVARKFQYEDEVTEQEYEWVEAGQTWIPLVSRAVLQMIIEEVEHATNLADGSPRTHSDRRVSVESPTSCILGTGR
jgi:hypothetical protein